MRLQGQGCAFIFVATIAGLLHCTPASAGDGGDLLLALIRKHGGEAHVEVAEVKAGLRGALATKNFSTNDIVISVPRNLVIELAPSSAPSHECAAILARRWRADTNLTSYWQFLPDQLLTRNSFPEAALELLQSKAMKGYALVHQVQAEDYYDKEDLAAEGINEAEFRLANDIIGAYTFTFELGPGKRVRYLLPGLDVLNYGDADDAANIDVHPTDDGSFLAAATRPIREGQEVFFSYTPACRRNDYSLFHYGFLQHRDPPRLCALDTPGGSLYTPSGLEEDRDYGHGGILATQEELQRLEALLASFPTTEDEDARLLRGRRSWLGAWGARLGEVERLFVEFRLLRKRALRHNILRLQGVLASADSQEL